MSSGRHNSKTRSRANTAIDRHGSGKDDLKQMWSREKDKMRQEVDAELKKKYNTQRRKLEQEKKKFDKAQAKFNKEKKDVNRLKTQLDAEKRVFTQSMRKSRKKDFNPNTILKEIESKISELLALKAKANEEWEKVKAYRTNEEAALMEQRNKMNIEQDSLSEMFTKFEKDKDQLQLLMNQQVFDHQNIEKRRQALEEAEKVIEEAVGKVQKREVNIKEDEEQMSRKWKDYKRSQDNLIKKELKIDEWESDLLKQKNTYDIIELNQQSKERELKHLEEQIDLNMQNLQKERENWDLEQKRIFFDKMFMEKRAMLKQEIQKFEDEKSHIGKIRIEQEAMSADLQKKMENIESEQKQIQSMKIELDEQLIKIDKERAETTLAIEEINKSKKQLYNATSQHKDVKRELKIQQDQINLGHQKLQEMIEKKVRDGLSVEKAHLDKIRKNLDSQVSRQKTGKTTLLRELLAFKKQRVENNQVIARQKKEIEEMKKEVGITRQQLQEDKKRVEDQKLQASKELDRLENERKQLQADRETIRETVEKEILNKYKTMMSYAEKHTNTITQDHEAISEERRKIRHEKLELEKQQENLELEIKKRVKSRVAEHEIDLARKEMEFTKKSSQMRQEWEKIQDEQLSNEKAKHDVMNLKNDSEQLKKQANEKFVEAAEQMKAVCREKRLLEEKHRKLESKLKELTRKEELYSEKQELLSNERYRLQSQAGKISELPLTKNSEFATLEGQVATLEKSNRTLHSQLDLLRKELNESKENFNSHINDMKKNSTLVCVDVEGGPCSQQTSPPAARHREMTREYWIDEKFGDNLPSIPVKMRQSPLKSLNGQRDRNAVTRYDLLSRCWDDHLKRNYNGESVESISMNDNTSYIYSSGFSRPWKPSGTFSANFSKARPPKRKQPGQAPSEESEESEMQNQPSKFFINMIESGEHVTTTFFFLGPERKVVKTIKGIMLDASPKLKELVQANETLEFPGLTLQGFEVMLQFIYSKEATWSIESLVPTMACASKFELDNLYRACFEWLEINVQPEDAVSVLDDCITHGKVLGERTKQAVEKAAWDIIISDGCEEQTVLSKVFVNHNSQWVKNVVKGSSLVCSEELMFDAVAHWATEEANRKFPDNKSNYPEDWQVTVDEEKCPPGKLVTKAEVVKNILPMVPFMRFPAMSSQHITSSGLIGALLKPMDILEILRFQQNSRSCNTRFKSIPRYKIVEVSQEGCCAQSSEHFATIDYNPKLVKNGTGDGNYPLRISDNMLGKVLRAELALTSCLFDMDGFIEGPAGLDVAQTKLDFQPWWDLDLGRLCRIQKVQVLLGAPGRIPGRTETDQCGFEQGMFPLALCLGRDSFPALEGTLNHSMQMSVKTKVFEKAPTGNLVELEWEPALVAARTFRIQCAKATSLRIMNVRIYSAEPIMSSPQT